VLLLALTLEFHVAFRKEEKKRIPCTFDYFYESNMIYPQVHKPENLSLGDISATILEKDQRQVLLGQKQCVRIIFYPTSTSETPIRLLQ
jgi:hypothetical protein